MGSEASSPPSCTSGLPAGRRRAEHVWSDYIERWDGWVKYGISRRGENTLGSFNRNWCLHTRMEWVYTSSASSSAGSRAPLPPGVVATFAPAPAPATSRTRSRTTPTRCRARTRTILLMLLFENSSVLTGVIIHPADQACTPGCSVKQLQKKKSSKCLPAPFHERHSSSAQDHEPTCASSLSCGQEPRAHTRHRRPSPSAHAPRLYRHKVTPDAGRAVSPTTLRLCAGRSLRRRH